MISKYFSRKQVCMKHFLWNFSGQNFLWLQNHFLENRFAPKLFYNTHWKCLDQICLMFQNQFLENRSAPKKLVKNLLSKHFYACKIISSKTGLQETFSLKIFCSKIFYGFKVITSKTSLHQQFSKTTRWRFVDDNFLRLQNHNLVNRLASKCEPLRSLIVDHLVF